MTHCPCDRPFRIRAIGSCVSFEWNIANDRLHGTPDEFELERGKMNRSIALAKPSSS
jgi:hypothetical protein